MCRLFKWAKRKPAIQTKQFCIDNALACVDELKRNHPDWECMTVSGLMLNPDGTPMQNEKGQLEFHRRAARKMEDGTYEYYKLRDDGLIEPDLMENWDFGEEMGTRYAREGITPAS